MFRLVYRTTGAGVAAGVARPGVTTPVPEPGVAVPQLVGHFAGLT
jgi:hypothetical protein